MTSLCGSRLFQRFFFRHIIIIVVFKDYFDLSIMKDFVRICDQSTKLIKLKGVSDRTCVGVSIRMFLIGFGCRFVSVVIFLVPIKKMGYRPL